jgi:HEAT repeat protein
VVDALIGALNDRENEVLQSAISALSAIGDPKAIPPALALLQNRNINKEVRKAASMALEKLGWQPGNNTVATHFYLARNDFENCTRIGAQAVGILTEALQDRQEDWVYITKTLGIIADHKAVKPLLDFIKKNEKGPAVIEAIHALGRIGDPAVTQTLTYKLSSFDFSVNIAAANALGEIADAGAIDSLVEHLGDLEHYRRAAAANALISIYRKGKLTETQKQKILQQHSRITSKHSDNSQYFEPPEPGCAGGTVHTDNGIGIEFPM